MADPKQKLVKVDDGIVAFPGDLPDEHVVNAIKLFRAKKKVAPLQTEESEHARQLKPAQPLDSAIPHLPQWANTPVLSGLTFDAQIQRAEKSGHPEQAEWLRKQKSLQDKAYQKNIDKHPIATGVGEGVGETAEGLTSPANLALMITAPESKIMSGLFAIQSLHGSYKDVEEARKAYREGRNAEASKYATQAVLNLGIAGLAGHHAVKDIPVPEGVKDFVKSEEGFVDPIKQWPQFKQWFGNSKVVDENGAPKPLLHSTNSTWDVFDPNMAKRGSFGFHAGTAEQAEKVRDTGGTSSDVTAQRSLNGMNFMPVYLKINNPLRMIDKGTWSPWELIDRLDKEHNIRVNAEPPSFKEGMRIMDYPSHMEINWERRSPARQNFDIASKQHMDEWRKGRPDASREQYEDEQHKFEKQYVTNVMEGAGYDGIVYDNKYEKGGDSYMAFHPEQIKSAIGNSGAFDPKSGSLTDPRAPKLADVKAKAAELKPTTAIETPEFKAWFGDWQDPHAFSSKRDPKTPQVSMAINEDGTPRVFYHGTQGDFDTFESGRPTKNTGMMGIPYDATRAGIFFTPDAAHTGDWLREWDRRGNAGVARNGNVMPVYLNIKAPLDLDNVLKGHNPLDEDARSEFEKEGINPRWFNSVQHSWELFDDADGKNFVAAAKRLGYDGATIKEEDLDGNEHDVWVAFDPEQIKSAIGNKGTFDPKKASILLGIPLAAGALTLAQVKANAQELQDKQKKTGVTQ